MFGGFKKFIFRGNIIDLAVAVVMGSAFGSVVTALVNDIITPLISVIGGTPDFSKLVLTINGSTLMIGHFLNALISFVMVAGVIYFFVIVPMNKMMSRMKKGEKIDPLDKLCPQCLSTVPLKAVRCRYCASLIGK